MLCLEMNITPLQPRDCGMNKHVTQGKFGKTPFYKAHQYCFKWVF